MSGPPFMAKWDGEVFVPQLRYTDSCKKQFLPGATYVLNEVDEHSESSRGHYFACVKKAWLNLPEQWGNRFPTDTTLRKWALIRAGYCHQFVCNDRNEAMRWVGRMRELAGYAEIATEAGVTAVLTPESQSKKSMGRKRFQESKQAVLEILASLIDVDVDELTKKDAA